MGDGGEQGALAVHQVSGVDLGLADEPVHRGRDAGESEIELGLPGLRAGRLHGGLGTLLPGERGLVVLAGDRVLVHQRLEPGHVLAGPAQLRLGAREPASRLRDRDLERPWIDGVEELTVLDEGPLGEVDAIEVPVHARPDLHLLGPPRLAGELGVDRDVLLRYDDRLDLGGRRRRGGRLSAADEEDRSEDSNERA